MSDQPSTSTETASITASSLIRITPATRFHPSWRASANGAFEVSGKTKQVVLARLAAALEEHERNSMRREYRLLPNGGVFVLYYSRGWTYDIFTPTHKNPSSCALSTQSYIEALAMMEEHWRSYSQDDDTSPSATTPDAIVVASEESGQCSILN